MNEIEQQLFDVIQKYAKKKEAEKIAKELYETMLKPEFKATVERKLMEMANQIVQKMNAQKDEPIIITPKD